MQLRQLEVFFAVMSTGSITSASRLLNITQPGASKIIQELERKLGFSLFARTGGRLRPTPEASSLFQEVQLLYAQFERIQALARNLKQGFGKTTLRISCTTGLAHDVLPLAIQHFRKLHPECEVELHTSHAKGIIDALLLREIDLGFAFNPPDHPAIDQAHIDMAELVCIAPLGLDLGSGELEYAALARHPFIAMHRDDPLGVLFRTAGTASDIDLMSKVVVRTYLMARSLVQRGEGISVVDQYTALQGEPGSVQIYRLKPRIQFTVTALWARAAEPSLLQKALIKSFQKAEQELSKKLRLVAKPF
jgi:DNA-binding transcriptional LysR family regulator